MILSTTPQIEGHTIREYKGIVTGETIIGANMFKDLFAGIFMNLLWFFVGGIWIWLTHIFYGLIFCITIIGIPFGKMHFRLAKLALSPFGKELA